MPASDAEELAELEKHLEWAREADPSPGRLPGSRQFRKDWHRHGPDDVQCVIDACRANETALAGIRKKAAGERSRTQHLRDLAAQELHQAPSTESLPPEMAAEAEALWAEIGELRDESDERSRVLMQGQEAEKATLAPVQEKVNKLETQQRSLEQQLQRRKDALQEGEARVARQREALEATQQAVARLYPLVKVAQGHYGLDGGTERK